MASIQSERFFVRWSRSNFIFSYQSQVVLFCLLMSLPHVDDEVRITRVSTILHVTAWLILGLLRSICRAFDTRIFNDSDLDRNWVKLVPQKRDGANVLKCTHFLGKTYDFPMGQEGMKIHKSRLFGS
jgi:hypothetical protein